MPDGSSSVQLLNGEATFLDQNGDPLTAGSVFFFVPGSTVPKDTFSDFAQTLANPNPIILDQAGRAVIWGSGMYRQVVTDMFGNLQWDQLVGVPDVPVTVPSNPQSQFVFASDFGLRDGVTDDCVAIQNAVNFAATKPDGATVYLGPGPIQFTNNCQIIWPANASGVNLKGDGPQTTVISISGDLTGDVFVLTQGNLSHCQIRDLGIFCSGAGTGGALIHCVNCYAFHCENVRMWGGFYNGVWICGGPNQYLATIRDLVCPANATCNACIILGDDINGPAATIYIDTCKMAGSQFGIYLRNASEVSIVETDCLSHVQDGLVTAPAAGEVARLVTVSNTNIDSCGGAAVNIGNVGGQSEYLMFTDCTMTGNGLGLVISADPNCDSVMVTGCQFIAMQHEAIFNYGANGVIINGNSFVGCGTTPPNTWDVIHLENSIQNVVTSNFIGAGFGFPSVHRTAIALAGTQDYTVVNLNVTGSSGFAPFFDGSSGTHNYLATPTVGT